MFLCNVLKFFFIFIFKNELNEIFCNNSQTEQFYSALHDEFNNTEKQSAATKTNKTRGFRAINKNKK